MPPSGVAGWLEAEGDGEAPGHLVLGEEPRVLRHCDGGGGVEDAPGLPHGGLHPVGDGGGRGAVGGGEVAAHLGPHAEVERDPGQGPAGAALAPGRAAQAGQQVQGEALQLRQEGCSSRRRAITSSRTTTDRARQAEV